MVDERRSRFPARPLEGEVANAGNQIAQCKFTPSWVKERIPARRASGRRTFLAMGARLWPESSNGQIQVQLSWVGGRRQANGP